jgi:hypothetical protein
MRAKGKPEVDEPHVGSARGTEPGRYDVVPTPQKADLAIDTRITSEIAQRYDEDLGHRGARVPDVSEWRG